MSVKTKIWIGLLLAALALAGIGLWRGVRSMQITTTPIPAEVWLDSQRVGETPCKITLFDSKTHEIEIIALDPDQKYADLGVQFFPVRYAFTRASMPEKLTIPLLPEGYIINRWSRSSLSADWRWVVAYQFPSQSLVDLQDPENTIPADGLIALSPDAKLGLYDFEIAVFPPPSGDSQFWLVPIDRPDERVRIFEAQLIGTRFGTQGIGPQLGFSPDSKWLWFTAGEQVAIASVDDPQTLALLINSNGTNPLWAPAGDRLAVTLMDNRVQIYRLINDVWQKDADTLINGEPVNWSSDGNLLWVKEYETYNRNGWGEYIKILNLSNPDAFTTINFPGSGNQGIVSDDGSMLAMTYLPDRLAVIKSNGEILVLNDNEIINQVICWIDERLFMVRVMSEIRIINADTDLTPLEP